MASIRKEQMARIFRLLWRVVELVAVLIVVFLKAIKPNFIRIVIIVVGVLIPRLILEVLAFFRLR